MNFKLYDINNMSKIKANAIVQVILGSNNQNKRIVNWYTNNPKDEGCCGSCECGCATACNNGGCGAFGSCWQTCNSCNATCGCGMDILSGETCINNTYYVVAEGISGGYQGPQLLQFGFGYVLGTSSGYTATDYANNVAEWYLQYICDNLQQATTTKPTGTYNTIVASASNCYVMINDDMDHCPFSSPAISGCDYTYPLVPPPN